MLFLRGSEWTVNFRYICFGDMIRGGGNVLGELAVVGEQQQTLAVVIQPAHRIDARLDTPQQIHYGRTAFRIAYRCYAVRGLIHGEINRLLGSLNSFVVDPDVIAFGIGLGSELG